MSFVIAGRGMMSHSTNENFMENIDSHPGDIDDVQIHFFSHVLRPGHG